MSGDKGKPSSPSLPENKHKYLLFGEVADESPFDGFRRVKIIFIIRCFGEEELDYLI